MSAYLVSDKSLSVITKSILHYADTAIDHVKYLYNVIEKYHNGYLIKKSEYSDRKPGENLFYKLLEINLLSLGQRYEDIKDWSQDSESYKYDPKAPVVSIPILIDLLDNWQYQACEGCANETDFYKLTEKIQDTLSRMYVKINKRHETVWGIDTYKELEDIPGAVVLPGDAILLSKMLSNNV